MTRAESNPIAAIIAMVVIAFIAAHVCDCGNVKEYRARVYRRAS